VERPGKLALSQPEALANFAWIRNAAHPRQLLVGEGRIVRIIEGILVKLFFSHGIQPSPLGVGHQRPGVTTLAFTPIRRVGHSRLAPLGGWLCVRK
jgi:hypothetical protein